MAELWQKLEFQFTRDHEGRRERESVWLAKSELTLKRRKYRSAFELALILVLKYSDREIEENIPKDLPKSLQKRLG